MEKQRAYISLKKVSTEDNDFLTGLLLMPLYSGLSFLLNKTPELNTIQWKILLKRFNRTFKIMK